jgi:hypothetical protein
VRTELLATLWLREKISKLGDLTMKIYNGISLFELLLVPVFIIDIKSGTYFQCPTSGR